MWTLELQDQQITVVSGIGGRLQASIAVSLSQSTSVMGKDADVDFCFQAEEHRLLIPKSSKWLWGGVAPTPCAGEI